MITNKRLGVAFVLTLAAVTTAWASSASFRIRGEGIELGKAEEVVKDGKELPPRFHARAEVGKPFTLVAQGVVLPRGAAEQPGEPDCGAWLFDDAVFKLLPVGQKQADKTAIVIRLEPTVVGRTRVRFVGRILGYDRTFDVLLEVAAAKKE